MLILHVIPTYYPAVRYGGPIVSVHGLCKALAKEGHEVHVYTTNVDGKSNSDVPLGEPVEIEGVQVWYYTSPFLRRLYYSPNMKKDLCRHIKKYDLVHIHSIYLWPTYAAARIARLSDIPYIMSPRGMLVKELVSKKSRWVKSAWLRLIECSNIEHARAIHVTSDNEETALHEFNFELPNVFNIPNGLDPLQFNSDGKVAHDVQLVVKSSAYVLYFGRINWEKGLDRLIKTWRYIKESQLVIAGNDEEGYLSKLQELVASIGLNDRVTFLPRGISGADKNALFQNAKLFVLPSYSENFGNVVLEAMSKGLPVIVTPEVGASSVVQNTRSGLVVDGEPEKMAPAIKRLLNDEIERNRMGKEGRNAVENSYSWSKISESMGKVYNSIVKENK